VLVQEPAAASGGGDSSDSRLACTIGIRVAVAMPDWLVILLLVLGYFALMRWVLPRLGVPT
jgi:hypothetical protein